MFAPMRDRNPHTGGGRRMGGYDFPGQIATSDGSESNGDMGTGFIVLGNSVSTGSIRVGRTEEGTDSTREEMVALLEVLIGTKVTENLVVTVDNQSILREISRWVDEGGRTFLVLSANPDILRMVIGRLCMRIEQGTTTILCKIKNHRSDPLNETADDLVDLGRTIDQEHVVWTTRSNRMVFSWMDGQKSVRTSTWNQVVKNGVRVGAGRYRFEVRLKHQSMQTFWNKTCRELYRRTTLTEAQTRETTDQVKWESLKVNESKMAEQELDDEDRQARFWRRRPDGFTVNEKEHIIYVLEFKRVSDVGHEYVTETQQLAEAQHLVVPQGLQKLFKDT